MADANVQTNGKVITPEVEERCKVGVRQFIWHCDFSFTNHPIESPKFTFDGNLEWKIKIYPNGEYPIRKFVSIYLTSLNQSIIEAKFSFSLVNGQKEEYTHWCTHDFNVNRSSSKGILKWVERDILQNSNNEYFSDGKLTISCKIHVIVPKKPFKAPECCLSNDYGNLLETLEFSDVTISVSGSDIQAHKAILAARSPVFKAMFRHPMKESVSSSVVIEDIEVEVFQEMLHFIYTGQAPNLDEMVDSLLVAADKYGLDRLKIMCEDVMCDFLTVENVARTLIFAHLHSADHLKAFAIKFVVYHPTEVIDTDGWKTNMICHPGLILEAFKAVSLQLEYVYTLDDIYRHPR